MLTVKARVVYEDIAAMGGGKIEESSIRKRTGLSHGSFSAARRELVEAGKLALEKDGRQTVYVLKEKAAAKVSETKEKEVKEKEEKDGVMLAAVKDMPRVIGEFVNFDDWEEALMAKLGSCLDISEGLVGGEYTVYSHEYEQEASYVVQMKEGKICVN